MTASRICVGILLGLSLLAALAAAGCRRGDACTKNCLLRAHELHCGHPDRCAATCDEVRHATACATAMKAFMQCALMQPKQQWVCSDDGVPGVSDEACNAERAGVLDCLQKSNGKL
jgi:hypothetical protein